MRGPRQPVGVRAGGGAGGSALPPEAFYETARTLGVEAFEQRYGSGFLMAMAARLGGGGESSTRMLLDGIDEDPGHHTADLAVLVHLLRPRAGSGGHLVTLGREARHDVVIPDVSVSRFHAFVGRARDGGFLIQDAGSTNGTSVNGVSVPPRGAGPPTRMKPGDTVKLGQVEFTFTDARALREFVLQSGA